jgi:hypothetical protein
MEKKHLGGAAVGRALGDDCREAVAEGIVGVLGEGAVDGGFGGPLAEDGPRGLGGLVLGACGV